MDNALKPNAILAENIRKYRLERGLSQTDAAKTAGLSRNAYLNLEAGRSEPRFSTLLQLANLFGVKLEDFFTPPRTLHSVRFRAHKQMTTRDEILHRVGRWLDSYVELELITKQVCEFPVKKIRGVASRVKSGNRAEVAAQEARKAFGLNDTDAIRDICGLFEDKGIKVFAMSVKSDGFFGLSVGEEDGGPAVAVNTDERIPVERQIFTAAHELGHLILHLDAFNVNNSEEDERQEKEANLFAGCFLMPKTLFESEWEETRGLRFVDRVLKVKRIFNVSYKTVLYRVGEVTNERQVWERFKTEYKEHYQKTLKFDEEPDGIKGSILNHGAPARLEPRRLDPADFMVDRLNRLVRKALEDQLISRSRAAEILGMPVPRLLELQKSWALH